MICGENNRFLHLPSLALRAAVGMTEVLGLGENASMRTWR
jgi:hypothetical protein